MDVSREPPLTFGAIEPVVMDSRICRFMRRRLDALARATTGARTITIAARVARLGANRPGGLVANAAWLIATAALTHIAMLLFVERYHFPNRAALILPIVVAVVALIVLRLSGDIERALADRHHR